MKCKGCGAKHTGTRCPYCGVRPMGETIGDVYGGTYDKLAADVLIKRAQRRREETCVDVYGAPVGTRHPFRTTEFWATVLSAIALAVFFVYIGTVDSRAADVATRHISMKPIEGIREGRYTWRDSRLMLSPADGDITIGDTLTISK